MSNNPEFKGFGKRISPEIPVRCQGIDRQLTLTWNNTQVCFYNEGDGMFDHIDHLTEDRLLVRIFGNRELCSELVENEYPTLTRPTINDKLLEEYTKFRVSAIDYEINVLSGQPED
jgi:hypothetical protein